MRYRSSYFAMASSRYMSCMDGPVMPTAVAIDSSRPKRAADRHAYTQVERISTALTPECVTGYRQALLLNPFKKPGAA
jgi:hypothetical protein